MLYSGKRGRTDFIDAEEVKGHHYTIPNFNCLNLSMTANQDGVKIVRHVIENANVPFELDKLLSGMSIKTLRKFSADSIKFKKSYLRDDSVRAFSSFTNEMIELEDVFFT